ncbi:MAG TPA: tetratricopeptide repeat protein [Bacteroidota bacterium]|nr:tetratricopeptide repeat protein [Bacteroidota bacterium]
MVFSQKIGIFVAVALLLAAAPVRTQTREADIKYKLAQSYERGGDYESAVKLFEEVYQKDSSNYILFEALRRSYMQLKRYPDAIALVQQKLTTMPKDLNLLAELGTLYNLDSNPTKANECWETAITSAPNNEMTYRIVSNAMVESRLFEDAEKNYERGRTALGKPTLYASDLAYLYGVTLTYPQATKEYLNLLQEEPGQLATIQSRMAAYIGNTDGLAAATKVVEEAQKASSSNPELLQLQAWLYMEGKRFDAAYDVYRRLDKIENANGMEVYNFGERALREKSYAAAARAFADVITTNPGFSMMPQTKFGYARAMEDSTEDKDTLKIFGDLDPYITNGMASDIERKRFAGAIAEYQKVAADYPKTDIAAGALLRIATLKFEREFDLEGARTALEEISLKYMTFGSIAQEARLMLGDVYLSSGDIEKASATFGGLTDFRTVSEDTRERASFRLAQIDYLQGKFSGSLKKLADLTKNPQANITNEALLLNMFVQENAQQDSVALMIFAKSELQEREHKFAEALAGFGSLKKTHPNAPLADESLIRTGDIYTAMGKYREAIASYDTLIAVSPESVTLDKAMLKIGKIYQIGLNDNQNAVQAYQQLLIKYPNSIYASEARKQIRAMRGDTL